MATAKYLEKLRDPRWQKKRLQILDRDLWRCRKCADGSKTLHVHHQFYKDGAEPWEYEDFALVTLCSDCHESAHEDKKAAIQQIQVALAYRGQDHEMLWSLALALSESGKWKDPDLTDDEVNVMAGLLALVFRMRNLGFPIQDTAQILKAKHIELLSKAVVDA